MIELAIGRQALESVDGQVDFHHWKSGSPGEPSPKSDCNCRWRLVKTWGQSIKRKRLVLAMTDCRVKEVLVQDYYYLLIHGSHSQTKAAIIQNPIPKNHVLSAVLREASLF